MGIGAADDVELLVDVNIGGGLVGVLDVGIGTEEELEGGAVSPHVPKPGRHPVPQ